MTPTHEANEANEANKYADAAYLCLGGRNENGKCVVWDS